jgi:putative transposase
MSDSQLPMWQRWAQFRFSVIGELLSCPPQKGQLQKAIGRWPKKTTGTPLIPTKGSRFGASTIERWYYKAKDARIRSPFWVVKSARMQVSAGRCPRLVTRIKNQYETYPRWNVQLHYDNLKVVAKEKAEPGHRCPATRPCCAACAKTAG